MTTASAAAVPLPGLGAGLDGVDGVDGVDEEQPSASSNAEFTTAAKSLWDAEFIENVQYTFQLSLQSLYSTTASRCPTPHAVIHAGLEIAANDPLQKLEADPVYI